MGADGAWRVTRLVALVRLARVSNLPTVWSNVLAASVLAGGLAEPALALVLLAMSVLYSGGMILNDAFDREIDARQRPERPLPSGRISLGVAWTAGLGLLALGVGTLATFGAQSAVAAIALAGAILIYDAWHKGNPFGPFLMGACRALVYVTTVVAAGVALGEPVLAASLALLLYVAGVSFAARGSDARWPVLLLASPILTALATGTISILSAIMASGGIAAIIGSVMSLRSRIAEDREYAVGLLIAAIAIMDAVVAVAHGSPAIAIACIGLFVLTLALQRVVPGT